MSARSAILTSFARRWRGEDDRRRLMYSTARRLLFAGDSLERALAARQAVPGSISIPRDAGFCVLPPSAIDLDVPLVVEAAKGARDRWRAGQAVNAPSKAFLVNVLRRDEMTVDSPLLRFSLHPHVLTAVAKYLGLAPRLSAIKVLVSEPSAAAPSSSQLYHCDAADRSQIKIFVLCSDVTEDGGPLTIVRADASAWIRRRVRYRYGSRVTDEQMAQWLTPADQYAVTGPAGTVCFVDTSRCFHLGSRIRPNSPPRLVTMVQYLTPGAFSLVLERERGSFPRVPTAESRLQQLALRA